MAKRTFSADKLRTQREQQSFSQGGLATASGVSKNAIRAIETSTRQDPHISTLIDLADALGCGVDDFLAPVN